MNLINNRRLGLPILTNCISKIAVAVLTVVAHQGSALAQQVQSNSSTVLDVLNVYGEIDSSAYRTLLAKADAPNAIDVIEGEQLHQFNEQSLGDALRRVPGITFDGANRAREIRLRGLPGEYTQVLINGRPLIDGESRRNFEVDRIPTGLVERVEIIRTPRASQQGQGGAGTVNIVLKNDAQVTPQQFSVGGGYLEGIGELGELTLFQNGTFGAIEVALGLSAQRFQRSESKDTFNFNANGNPAGGELGTNERRFDQFNLMPRFALQTESVGRFEFDPFYLRTKEFRDDISIDLAANQVTHGRKTVEDRERVRESYGFHANWQGQINPSSNIRAGVDWQKGKTDTARDETRFNTNGTINRTRQRSERIDMELIRPELALTLDKVSHLTQVGVGAELRKHEETNAEVRDGLLRSPRNDRIFDIHETVHFVFLDDEWHATDRLRLVSGLRVESSKTKTTDFSNNENKESQTFWLPSVSTVFAATDQTDLRLGIARTLKRPDLRTLTPVVDEKSGTAADPDVRGNPNQQPESIWGIDLGIDHYFANQRGLLSLNLFNRKFNDKIEGAIQLDGGRYIATPQNLGDARARGVELGMRLPLDDIGLDNFTLWGNAVYTDSRVDSLAGGTRPFIDQPDLVGNLGVDYFFSPWLTTFGIAINQTSSIDQSRRLTNGEELKQSIDGRTRLDLSSRTELSDQLTLTFSVTNLLANTENRIDHLFDSQGHLVSTSGTKEPSYRSAFARLTWGF